MFKLIRHRIPFILLVCTALVKLWYNYELYFMFDGDYTSYVLYDDYTPFKYYSQFMGDWVGYSLLTGAFMLAVYMNKRYCDATKICVLGLIALNMFNLISHGFNFYSPIYDLYLCGGILCTLGVYFKTKRNV